MPPDPKKPRRLRPRETAPVVFRDPKRKGEWRGYIVAGGKRHYRRGASKTEVLAKLGEVAGTSPEAALSGRMTVQGLRDRWIKSLGSSRAENTVAYYAAALDLVADLGIYPIGELPIGAVVDSLDQIPTAARREDVYVALKALFAAAVRWGFLPENPIDRIDRPKHAAREPRPFQPDEIAAILEAATGSRYFAAVLLGMTVGPRPGELFGLQWTDWFGSTLKIERQAAEVSGKVTVKPPKTKTGVRSILLPDRVCDALAQRREDAKKEPASPWIFPSRRGGVTRRSNFVHRHWNPILKSAGVDRRGPHQMRHTAATALLNGGVPITLVSRILGHAKPSTTLNVYGHLMTTDLSRAVDFWNANPTLSGVKSGVTGPDRPAGESPEDPSPKRLPETPENA